MFLQIKTSCFLLAAMLPVIVYSQAENASTSTDSNDLRKNTISANLSYQNKLHYLGRVDSLNSSGLFPTLTFDFKNRLYLRSNFIFVQNPIQPINYTGSTLEAGYNFPESKHFSGNLFYTQFLYKDQSKLVQAALQAQTGVNLAYTNNIVNINLGGDLKFSDKTDVGASLGFDHLFIIRLKDKKALAFNPNAYLYAGTQQFSTTYIKNSGSTIPLFPSVSQQVTEEQTTFNILATEFSLPIVFVAGKFNASITPSYVMPQNLLQGEYGKNLFYTSISIGVRF